MHCAKRHTEEPTEPQCIIETAASQQYQKKTYRYLKSEVNIDDLNHTAHIALCIQKETLPLS